jgi:hypothetical protein
VLDAAPACAGQSIPPQVTRRLDRAFALLADARATDDRRNRRRYGRAGRLFSQAAKRAVRAAKLKTPRLTTACAEELRTAIESVAADAAAECAARGFCGG